MSLAIEIQDSSYRPRCSIFWENEDISRYSVRLSDSIGRLDSSSTTEDIVSAIRRVFPRVGVPRNMEFYSSMGVGVNEFLLSTKYADDLGLPDGNVNDGVLAFGKCLMSSFSRRSFIPLYLTLGKVSMEECLCGLDLEEYYSLEDYPKGSEGYKKAEWKIKDAKENALHIDDEIFHDRIHTQEQRNDLLNIIDNYEWVENDGLYYLVNP